MLDSIRAFVAHVWSWCLASPANAVFALAVLGFSANVATRFFTSKEWAAWCEKHPRVVGLFLIAKGAFPEGGTIARGFWAAVTGELRQRAREALPKTEPPKDPPTIPPVVLGAMLGALLFALVLPGCAWYQKHEAQIGKAERDILTCVMLHAASGQSVEEIAIGCAGVTATDVAEILLSQKRAGYVLQKPGVAPCASGAAK